MSNPINRISYQKYWFVNHNTTLRLSLFIVSFSLLFIPMAHPVFAQMDLRSCLKVEKDDHKIGDIHLNYALRNVCIFGLRFLLETTIRGRADRETHTLEPDTTLSGWSDPGHEPRVSEICAYGSAGCTTVD
ncbi:MAG: hypothetical protein AB7E80_05125 [Hyphomicrobiaceae bacterium]